MDNQEQQHQIEIDNKLENQENSELNLEQYL